MATINIDTNDVDDCANKIIEITNEMRNIVDYLYGRIEDMPIKTGEWVGISAEKFVESVKNDKNDAFEVINALYKEAQILKEMSSLYEAKTRELSNNYD